MGTHLLYDIIYLVFDHLLSITCV